MGINCCCCPPFETPIYFNDSFCRYFNVACGTTLYEVWAADVGIVEPFGSIVLYNEGNCAITLYLNSSGSSTATIQPGDSFSGTFNSLFRVQISCASDGTSPSRCKGRVCIDLHYRRTSTT
ncbi:S-Ena type endospore appendage [Rubeoparvulum massiliense]|uniref:S-Ena type endospore appendage n=1 Tax=Rubeoparvulum massiliense TaxID=1631346 RepID=UPI000976B63E|nr:S-Ena type endospore appendage [Rubeoparvulum massiliense]